MSSEGYYRVLCENGHYNSFDVYENEPEDFICNICGKKCAWSEIIDMTNGIPDGQDDYDKTKLEIDKKEVIEECDKCHSILKILKDITYKIPKKGKGVW